MMLPSVSSRPTAWSGGHGFTRLPGSHLIPALPSVHQGWCTSPTAPAGHEQDRRRPILEVVFFRTETGNEPVRAWLRELVRKNRKTVGEEIQTAQFG